jgi:DsbC/DsbD-like thiol-disulfide interchange protein
VPYPLPRHLAPFQMRPKQSFSAAHPTAAFPSLVRVLAHCVLLFVVCSFRSFAASDNPLQIELVSSVTSIQPGTPFRVGLHLQHPEGYHTYWKYPGIVGVPTNMAWQLPEGWKAEPIEWPAPERVFMFQIKAQGFHGDEVLPIRLTPPSNLKDGSKVTLKGKATWMCCGRDCNPGFRDMSLELPVSAEAPKADERWERAFDDAASAIATECPECRPALIMISSFSTSPLKAKPLGRSSRTSKM